MLRLLMPLLARAPLTVYAACICLLMLLLLLLQDDLGHVAAWLHRMTDPKQNPLSCFLESVYVCYPMPIFKLWGVLIVDLPGVGDSLVLRSLRAIDGSKDAEAIMVVRAQYESCCAETAAESAGGGGAQVTDKGLPQENELKKFLKAFMKVRRDPTHRSRLSRALCLLSRAPCLCQPATEAGFLPSWLLMLMTVSRLSQDFIRNHATGGSRRSLCALKTKRTEEPEAWKKCAKETITKWARDVREGDRRWLMTQRGGGGRTACMPLRSCASQSYVIA